MYQITFCLVLLMQTTEEQSYVTEVDILNFGIHSSPLRSMSSDSKCLGCAT